MDDLILWNKSVREVLVMLGIKIDTAVQPLRWVRELYYTTSSNSHRERFAVALWELLVLQKIKDLQSLPKAQELFSASRPNSPERIKVFEALLTFAHTDEEVRSALNLVSKSSPEATLAREKLRSL